MSIINVDFIVEHKDDYEQTYQLSYPATWNTQTQEIIPMLPNGYDDGYVHRFIMRLPSGIEVPVIWDSQNQAFRILEDDENDEYE